MNKEVEKNESLKFIEAFNVKMREGVIPELKERFSESISNENG